MMKECRDFSARIEQGGVEELIIALGGDVEAGLAIARRVYDRHRLLTEFFVRLGVDPEVAARDACRVEHDLSEQTFEKLVEHAQKKFEKDS